MTSKRLNLLILPSQVWATQCCFKGSTPHNPSLIFDAINSAQSEVVVCHTVAGWAGDLWWPKFLNNWCKVEGVTTEQQSWTGALIHLVGLNGATERHTTGRAISKQFSVHRPKTKRKWIEFYTVLQKSENNVF